MRDRSPWFFVLPVFALACGSVYVQPPPPAYVDVSSSATAEASADTTANEPPTGSATASAVATAPSTAPSATAPVTTSASASVAPPVPSASASAAPTAASPGVATLAGDAIEVSTPIGFELGSAKLRVESNTAIQEIVALLRLRSDITLVRVEVHTDSDGDDKANLKLSDERALAIARSIRGAGIDCKRLIAVGFGETKPLAPNDSAVNKAKNRRVTLAVAALRGRPIASRPVDGGGHVAGDPCQ